MKLEELAPLTVYGSTASYFTGKLEAYLRARGIPYFLEPFSTRNMKYCTSNTGVVQIPQVECADGSWLVDTTLIIEYFEKNLPPPQITPASRPLAFVSRLIEDYADEWLWRPAMHYRWSYPETAYLMSSWLAEHIADQPGPAWVKRLWWKIRQKGIFVRGDGVNSKTINAVESFYLDTLDALETIFQNRPYVLGERPTEADFGLFGPMFRHFFCDPAPARIMRERAPAVHEWVARIWNINPEKVSGQTLADAVPPDLSDLLKNIATDYLPYLEANALAYANGDKKVSYEAGGATFTEPVKPYRVWCRDRLQSALSQLGETERDLIAEISGAPDAITALTAPSLKPASNILGELPIAPGKISSRKDSWWR